MLPCLAYSSMRSGRIPSEANRITFSDAASSLVPEALPAPSETTRAIRKLTMAATPPSLRLVRITLFLPFRMTTRHPNSTPRNGCLRPVNRGLEPGVASEGSDARLGGGPGRGLQLSPQVLDLVP